MQLLLHSSLLMSLRRSTRLRFGLALVICFWGQYGLAQERRGGQKAKSGLVSPLPIPLVLAGNFGELRPNHFHSGLDFKTLGREGIPVLAATDGVVERVKVSPYGYGQALYLRSPSGITTVYAHLARFEGPLATWILEEQYRQKSHAIDTSPTRSFAYKQGDTLAYSGNTGGSMGPHLHFEVRDGATQRPINPLLWNLPVQDLTPPEIGGLWVLPVDGSEVNGGTAPIQLQGEHRSAKVSGSVRLALDALDRLDAARNVCGPYRLVLKVNGKVAFESILDTLDFSLQRDMNAHAFFDRYRQDGSQTHRLHRLPGNRLPIYKTSSSSEMIHCPPGDTIRIEVLAEDVHGNRSTRDFALFGLSADPLTPQGIPAGAAFVRYDAAQQWVSHDSVAIFVDADTFYEDHWFPVESGTGPGDWIIGEAAQPAAQPFTVHLPRVTSGRGGFFAELLDEQGDSEGTFPLKDLGNGYLELRTRTCGHYRIREDATAPEVKLLGGPKDWARWGDVRWSFMDTGVGPDSHYTASLNGEWVRLAWDPRINELRYALSDNRHTSGVPGTWRIEAQDELGNRVVWLETLKIP